MYKFREKSIIFLLFAHYNFSGYKIIKNHLNNRIFWHFFTLTPKCRHKTLYINMLQLSHKKNTSCNAPFRTFRSKTHSDISYQKSMNRLLSYLLLSRQNILRHSTQKKHRRCRKFDTFLLHLFFHPIFTPILRPLLSIPRNAITISTTFFCLLSICFLPLPPLSPYI